MAHSLLPAASHSSFLFAMWQTLIVRGASLCWRRPSAASSFLRLRCLARLWLHQRYMIHINTNVIKANTAMNGPGVFSRHRGTDPGSRGGREGGGELTRPSVQSGWAAGRVDAGAVGPTLLRFGVAIAGGGCRQSLDRGDVWLLTSPNKDDTCFGIRESNLQSGARSMLKACGCFGKLATCALRTRVPHDTHEPYPIMHKPYETDPGSPLRASRGRPKPKFSQFHTNHSTDLSQRGLLGSTGFFQKIAREKRGRGRARLTL